MDPELLKRIDPKDFYEAYLKEGIRPDFRKLHSARKVAITLKDSDKTCMVRLGNTSVWCNLVEGSGIEGWSDLSYLGRAKGKVRVFVLEDDGNLIEAVTLCYQILIEKEEIEFPFTFAELYGQFIRDPNKDEEDLSKCVISLFVTDDKANVIKTQGSPISVSDIESLILTCQRCLPIVKHNLATLKTTKTFIGSLYSTKPNKFE